MFKQLRQDNLLDPEAQFWQKRDEMIALISMQKKMRKKRLFYSYEEKQKIVRYIPRLEPDKKYKEAMQYRPPLDRYVNDLITIMDHIFSYEFKTSHLDQEGNTAAGAEE